MALFDHLGLFFGSDQQGVALLAVFAVWIFLVLIGGAVGGQSRVRAADAIVGWGLAGLVFTVAGTTFKGSLDGLVWGLPVAALGAALWRLRTGGLRPSGLWPRMLVMGAPFLLIASAMVASQWDEFSHWLPSARFLFETNGLPGAGAPETGASYPSYPYGWPYLIYAASRYAGAMLENAGGLFNSLLLFSFGLAAIGVIADGAGAKVRPTWRWAALALLCAVLFNPSFVQKIVLTSYADTGLGVGVGFAVILAWRMLGACADGDRAGARAMAWQLGMVLAALINIKPVSPVLVAVVLFGVAVAALRDPKLRLADGARLMVPMLVPALLVYGLWRVYVAGELPGQEMTVMPFAQWNWRLIPDVLLGMAKVASKKGVFFAVMLISVGFAARGLWRYRSPLDRLAIIVAAAFLGYNAFLLFSYIAIFGEGQALRVASYWRYNMHVGLLAVVFGGYGLARLWRLQFSEKLAAGRLGAIGIVLVLAAPLLFAPKLRFDFEPPKPFYRAVAAALRPLIKPGTPIRVIDPQGTGEARRIIAYDLGWYPVEIGGISAFQNPTPAVVRTALAEWPENAKVLVLSVNDGVRQVLGDGFKPGTAYLLEKRGGAWQAVWQYAGAKTVAKAAPGG